jgi:hypothetical protein
MVGVRMSSQGSNRLPSTCLLPARPQAQQVSTSVVEAPLAGPQGVARALKGYAASRRPDVMVLGSRGLGALTG